MKRDPRLPGHCIRCQELTYLAQWTGPPEDPDARKVSVCPDCVDHFREHPEELRALSEKAHSPPSSM